MDERPQDKLKQVSQLHMWNQKVLRIGGIWPLEKSSFKFYVGALYFVVHVVLTLTDLISVFGNLALLIANLLETSVQLMVAARIVMFKNSRILRDVLEKLQNSFHEDRYIDEEEKNIYLSYNEIGRLFFRTASYFGATTIILFFLKPVEDIARAAWQNETIPFVLPCRMALFFEITDSLTYTLAYLSQLPMMYYYFVYESSTCLLSTLIVHIAGDLAVLAHRIRNINSSKSLSIYGDLQNTLCNIVVEHNRIISMAAAINDIFNLVLLLELSISTMLIGLTCYNVLLKSMTVSMIDFFFILSYSVIVLILIFIYCIIGDFLIRESMNVHDAYYECLWYDMRPEYQKYLVICMSRARNPLQLTAGRFYVFSLSQFTDILKTSMAYISMLRTVV